MKALLVCAGGFSSAIAAKALQEAAEKKGLKLTLCDGLYKILNKEIRPMDFLDAILNLGKVNA